MKGEIRVDLNTNSLQMGRDVLDNYLNNVTAILKQRNPAEIIRCGRQLNALSIILQATAQKLNYVAMPERIPPSWFNGKNDAFLKLHRRINKILEEQNTKYEHFKYNHGALYQSLSMLNIFGGRETETRYEVYGLDKIIKSDDFILDIGANCGFMVIYSVFRKGCQGDCIEWNPYMVKIGEAVTEYLKLVSKIRFFSNEFQHFTAARKYSVVLSLASHWTTDEGLRLTFREHMEKIHALLEDNGTLVFETQGREYLQPGFYEKLDGIRDIFNWDSSILLKSWSREVFIMQKK